MPDRIPSSASASLVLTMDSHGRWSLRMSSRPPGRTWRGIQDAWIETGRVPELPVSHADMEKFIVSVLMSRRPEEYTA